jgi:putative transposase-like DNA-binding protein
VKAVKGVKFAYSPTPQTLELLSMFRDGRINKKLKITEKSWLCPCGAKLDRDLNAAINIERRGKLRCLGEVRPGARGTDEAVKGNETTMAPILRAEAPKLGVRALALTTLQNREDKFTRPEIGLELPPTQDVTIYKQLG